LITGATRVVADGSLLSPLARKLLSVAPLCGESLSEIAVAARRTEAHPGGAMIRGYEGAHRQGFIASGWACQMRLMSDGRRQIFSFLIPGDPIPRRGRMDQARFALCALTAVRTTDFSALAFSDAPSGRAVAAAIAQVELMESERVFDHIVRLGRQTAFERMAHMLLEFRRRLETVGMTTANRYDLPLTQEHLADALGLSIVHANRTLQQLRREGLISLSSGCVTLLNPARMAMIADYEDRLDASNDRDMLTA